MTRKDKEPALTNVPLGLIGGGAAGTFFAVKLREVLDSIDDPRTRAKATRKIVLEFTFKPSEDRDVAELGIVCKASVPSIKSYSSVLFQRRRDMKLEAYQELLPLPLAPAGEEGEIT